MKLKPMQQLRPDLLQKALAAHRKGDIGAAERLYLDILRAAPAEFNALHLLGVIRAQQRRFEEAERLIRRAVQANPTNAEAQNNLGNVLFELGRRSPVWGRAGRSLRGLPRTLAARFPALAR